MIVVVADTSGLLAAMDADHPHTVGAAHVLSTAGTVVIPPLLLSELDHVARRVIGERGAHRAIDDIIRWARAGRALLPEIDADILATAQSVRRRYGGLGLDLADAVIVAVAAQFHTDAILTMDRRDFRAVRPLTSHVAFRVLPDDMPDDP